MKGTYQHRIFFIYIDLFTVDENGIWIKKEFYPWSELKALQLASNVAILEISNKKKIIQARRFRKKDSPLTLTFFGENETFKLFSTFITLKIHENERGQEYKRLQDRLEDLIKVIDKTTEENKLPALMREYQFCLSKLNDLNQLELEKIRKKRQKSNLHTVIAFVIFVGVLVFTAFT